MPISVTEPRWVDLWAGWRVPLGWCQIDRELDGSFVAWTDDWSLQLNIVEVGAQTNTGAPMTKELLIQTQEIGRPFDGNGWIGKQSLVKAEDDETQQILATQCADQSVLYCTFSCLEDQFLRLGHGVVGAIEHYPPKQNVSAGMSYHELDECDQLLLGCRRAAVEARLSAYDMRTTYQTGKGKLNCVRGILFAKQVSLSDNGALMALGTIFADVFVQDAGFHWVQVRQGDDRYLALRYKETSVVINAAESLAKRLEAGEKVNVHELYKLIADKVNEVLASGQYD